MAWARPPWITCVAGDATRRRSPPGAACARASAVASAGGSPGPMSAARSAAPAAAASSGRRAISSRPAAEPIRERGQSRRARAERERRGLVATVQAAHQVIELRIPGLGGERELLAPDRRAVAAAAGVHGRVHGLARGERVEPGRQAVVELLFARRLVQRVEARAPHHRFADELGPGRVHRLEPGARRDLDPSPPQDRVPGELGQHRLVQLHVEMQHDRASLEAGAGRERGIHDARDRDRERTRDAQQESQLVGPQRGRHGEDRLVAGRRDRTPQRPRWAWTRSACDTGRPPRPRRHPGRDPTRNGRPRAPAAAARPRPPRRRPPVPPARAAQCQDSPRGARRPGPR